MKLSEVMWVQAGVGNSRKVMPFVVKGNLICSLSDDKLFQINSKNSMFDNLYEICQREYNCPTVIINNDGSDKVEKLDVTDKTTPTILNCKLPKLFAVRHIKEYMDSDDMTVSELEVKTLAKHFTKKIKKELEIAESLWN